MILPCEVAVRSVVPAIKAALATRLVQDHGMKQDQVAKILGISQSAVSKYSRQVRGYLIKVDEVEEARPLIDELLGLIVNETRSRTDFLELFCRTCAVIRKEGLMCQFCQMTDQKITKDQCDFCRSLIYSSTL